MPPTNAKDPFRTTDHQPGAAPPAADATTDAAPGSPAGNGGTVDHVPGPDAQPLVAVPQRGPGLISVPGYAIEEVLGRGGMGVVYKARHLALKRTVALKMVLAGGHAGPGELARFRIEAEAVARLQHPNIVQIHEVGEADGHPYCALEFVAGGNLASKLAGQPLPAREAARLVETLARAMQLAHSRNVVHRDLKPANILLTAEGTPKITDFGLARQLDSDSGETQAGAVMGTPSYMAPEQASGRAHEAGPAADVYALGAILYVCLAGRPPFQGKTIVETLDQVRTQEPAPPSRWQPSVPLDLETICLKCLRKEPEKRYASAAELADELVRYQQGEPILARPVGRIERGVKWIGRNPVVAGRAALLVLALAIATPVSYQKFRETKAALDKADKALRKEAESNDRLLGSMARSLLRPLAVQVQADQPLPPLNEQEIEPLWELASTPEERLRLRFVEEALRDPSATRRLKDRSMFAFQAAVGLDRTRRLQVEALLGRRLQAKETSAEQQEQVALCLAHLGIRDRSLAGRTAVTLTQGLSKTTNPSALRSLAEALSAVSASLEPKEAAQVCGQAAATLIQALIRATDPFAWQYLAEGLAAVSASLEPKEAAQVCGQAAATLTQALTRTTDYIVLQYLVRGLSAVSVRLEPKDAAEAAATFTQAMTKTTHPNALRSLAEALAAVSARLEPKDAAATLAQVLTKTTDPNAAGIFHPLAQGLSAVWVRLEPKDAAEAAAILTQAMTKTRDPNALGYLAQGVAAVSAHLEPKDAAATLTQAMTKTTAQNGLQSLVKRLSAVSARLEPKDAAEAAAILTQAMIKARDTFSWQYLAEGVAAVSVRLEPKDAAEAAATLTQGLTKPTYAFFLQYLAKALSAVSARLEPKQAAQVCGQAAATLTQALTRTTNPFALESLAEALSAVSAHLEPKDAAEAAAALTQALTRTKAPFALHYLAWSLSVMSVRLEPKDAAQLCGQAAATLTQALTRTTDPKALQSLAQGLSAVSARLEPKDAADTLTQALTRTTDPKALQSLAEALSAVSARLEPKDAAEACRQAAATLIQAMTRTTDPNALQPLAQGLAAVLFREDSTTTRQRLLSVTATVGGLGSPGLSFAALGSAQPALEPMPPLPPQTLVELLKNPFCVSEARRLVLEQLSRHYHRPFADQWDFVQFVTDNQLPLDLTTPPVRPQQP